VLPEQDAHLAPATDLRVTRRVGQDGLVVAWQPSPDPHCAGYLVGGRSRPRQRLGTGDRVMDCLFVVGFAQICINDQEAQRVRSAQRTKAVLCGLDLQQHLEICIYSLSVAGRISTPARARHQPDDDRCVAETGAAVSAGDLLHVTGPDERDNREVVVQTFYTNSSVCVRSSRRVPAVHNGVACSRIPLPVSFRSDLQ